MNGGDVAAPEDANLARELDVAVAMFDALRAAIMAQLPSCRSTALRRALLYVANEVNRQEALVRERWDA